MHFNMTLIFYGGWVSNVKKIRSFASFQFVGLWARGAATKNTKNPDFVRFLSQMAWDPPTHSKTVSQAWIWQRNRWLFTFYSALKYFSNFSVQFYSIIVVCIQYLWKQLIASKKLTEKWIVSTFSINIVYICLSKCVQHMCTATLKIQIKENMSA